LVIIYAGSEVGRKGPNDFPEKNKLTGNEFAWPKIVFVYS
jgi:hypothetical protein